MYPLRFIYGAEALRDLYPRTNCTLQRADQIEDSGGLCPPRLAGSDRRGGAECGGPLEIMKT